VIQTRAKSERNPRARMAVLEQAYEKGWPLVVILTHSFELVTDKRHRANRIAVRRFERLCRYLDEQRERFRTVWFEDLDPVAVASAPTDGDPLSSNVLRTLARVSEQAVTRWDEWRPPARRAPCRDATA